MNYQEFKPIVIDNGTYSMKSGFVGDEKPISNFRTIVGTPRGCFSQFFEYSKAFYVGDSAMTKLGILRLIYPIERGEITNYDSIEQIWKYIFGNKLAIEPEDHPVFMTESPVSSKQNREKMTQIMFECFSIPEFYIGTQGPLSLYSCGKLTGTVVKSSGSGSFSIPVEDGFMIRNRIGKLDITGSDLTESLMNKLNERGYNFTTTSESEIVRDIKEKCCYVAEDYQKEMEKDLNVNKQSYELPDGQIISICREMFQSPEMLFHSSSVDDDLNGIHMLTYRSIIECNVDIREALFENIVLTGGNTLLKGFDKRFKNELNKVTKSSININVCNTFGEDYSEWFGGSIFASNLPNELWCSKDEYDEYGPMLINKKCY